MKNDRTKLMQVVVLDSTGNPFPGVHDVIAQGAAGILVRGRLRMLTWADENKTWKRVEDSK